MRLGLLAPQSFLSHFVGLISGTVIMRPKHPAHTDESLAVDFPYAQALAVLIFTRPSLLFHLIRGFHRARPKFKRNLPLLLCLRQLSVLPLTL